ncbi:MAG TPA: DUF222 domain-containing protein [Acidimicrobiales bacterium]|nr:DUF222 domain-containing protein [Acidimicrobiales bacterium]
MLTTLADAIENLEIPLGSEALVEAIALRDRLDARIAQAAVEFEAGGWCGLDYSTSMVAWLRTHAGMTKRSAQRLRTLGVRMRSLPVCAEAYASGELSGGQVDAIIARLDDELTEVFAAQEAELVPYLLPLSVAGVSRAMGAWLTRNRPEPTIAEEPDRSLHLSRTIEDRWAVDGWLDAEGGSVVATALRLATPERPDIPRHPAARRADALVDVCRFFLDHQQTRAGGRHRPHLNVVVNLEDLIEGQGGSVVDGPVLDGPAMSRLLCDSTVHRVVMSGRSAVLDYGTATRTIPAPLWNALVIRDEACRFPGCDRPSVWCEGHHVVWVTHGGPTELANLALVCSRHHHLLHQPGWHAKLRPDGVLKVTDPYGTVRETSPPRAITPW